MYRGTLHDPNAVQAVRIRIGITSAIVGAVVLLIALLIFCRRN
jgi:hypothetical protein